VGLSARWVWLVIACWLAVAAAGTETTPGPAAAPMDTPQYASPQHPSSPRRADGKPITALSWGVVDVGTGQILYGKELLARRFPASTTKLLTTLLCLEAVEAGKVSLDDIVIVSHSASQVLESGLWLSEGEPISFRDLLIGVMVRSANDAAFAVAERVGGSVERFVQMMNERAEQLGCVDTHFVNPHGLHWGPYQEPIGDEHYSTGYDLLKITMACWRYPLFQQLCMMDGEKVTWLPPPPEIAARLPKREKKPGEPAPKPHEPWRIIHNRNRLLSLYPECIGVKTGYTKQAGACLVSAARRGDREVIAVTLHSLSGQDRWLESEAILRAGLDDFTPVTMLNAGEQVASAPVKHGLAASAPLVAASSINVLQHRLEPAPEVHVQVSTAVPAPVLAGLPMGVATVAPPGRPAQQVALLAAEDVPVKPPAWASWPTWPLVVLFGIGLVIYGALAEAHRRRG